MNFYTHAAQARNLGSHFWRLLFKSASLSPGPRVPVADGMARAPPGGRGAELPTPQTSARLNSSLPSSPKLFYANLKNCCSDVYVKITGCFLVLSPAFPRVYTQHSLVVHKLWGEPKGLPWRGEKTWNVIRMMRVLPGNPFWHRNPGQRSGWASFAHTHCHVMTDWNWSNSTLTIEPQDGCQGAGGWGLGHRAAINFFSAYFRSSSSTAGLCFQSDCHRPEFPMLHCPTRTNFSWPAEMKEKRTG
jgi:hypothetical protein